MDLEQIFNSNPDETLPCSDMVLPVCISCISKYENLGHQIYAYNDQNGYHGTISSALTSTTIAPLQNHCTVAEDHLEGVDPLKILLLCSIDNHDT